MIIPKNIILSEPTTEFFLYAAADSIYFDVHGKPLIHSAMINTSYHFHIHIYNPTKDQLKWCEKFERLSVSYEYVDVQSFKYIASEWAIRTKFNNIRERQMAEKGRTFGIDTMEEIIGHTYYACCRFIRLAEIKKPNTKCLSLDVDGLILSDFAIDLGDCDLYLYRKKSGEHLAGALLLNETSDDFLSEYKDALISEISKNNVYWFLDQVLLDQIVTGHNIGLLPMSYIDWEMSTSSAIWSAKGKRKNLTVFIDRQRAYLV